MGPCVETRQNHDNINIQTKWVVVSEVSDCHPSTWIEKPNTKLLQHKTGCPKMEESIIVTIFSQSNVSMCNLFLLIIMIMCLNLLITKEWVLITKEWMLITKEWMLPKINSFTYMWNMLYTLSPKCWNSYPKIYNNQLPTRKDMWTN